MLHSVKHAMKILHLFSADQPMLGVTDIAVKLGLPASTVHRLLSTLVKEGYLEKTEAARKYRLGFAVLGLAGIITTQMELHRQSLPILQGLVDQLGEAAHVGVLEGHEIVYLHKVDCKHPVRLHSYIGKHNPAFCSSAGKVILANQNERIVTSILHSDLKPYGPNSITDPLKLQENLLEIKRTGYAIAIDELHEGVVSIAVPVRDYTEEVVAAISIVGPKQRMPELHFPFYIQTLKQASSKLSKLLGFIR